MATPYPSSISREPPSDPNDDGYKFKGRYKEIVQNNYDKHKELGQSIPKELARVMASHMLQPNEIDAVLNKELVQYLGLEVLNVWMEKPGSTIWVLQHELEKLGLCESLAILENARLAPVSLCIMIYEMKNNAKVTFYERSHKAVPGKKPLVDFVRPIVYRTLGLKMTQMEEILHLRLDRSAEGDQDNTWSSPAQNFKGEQVDIHMFHTNASERRHTDPGQQKKSEGVTPIERNVISWVDEASLCFGYVDQKPATVSEDLVLPVQEMGLNQSMDELSLKSDISLKVTYRRVRRMIAGQDPHRKRMNPVTALDSASAAVKQLLGCRRSSNIRFNIRTS